MTNKLVQDAPTNRKPRLALPDLPLVELKKANHHSDEQKLAIVFKKSNNNQRGNAEDDSPSPIKNLDDLETRRRQLISDISDATEEKLRAYEQVCASFRAAHDGIKTETEAFQLPEVAPALWSERKTGREVSPAQFIRATYSDWNGKGLTRADIKRLDLTLYNAYAAWLRRNPDSDEKIEFAESRLFNRIESAEEAIERRRASQRNSYHKRKAQESVPK